jgi:hypothetical protein
MKVGDLVKFKNKTAVRGNMFLVMRTQRTVTGSTPYQRVWIYPDPDADLGYDHTDDDNYYYAHLFEVISESR